jgi:FtsP/CotA-like multicopper oxidase with cupredoxin domain
MPHLSRRSLLAAGAAMGALPLLPVRATAQLAAAPGTRRLTAGTRILDVNGRAAKVYGLTNETGQPGLTLAPGERFHVTLANQISDRTIIHWHGQLPPWRQDGFPWSQVPRILPGSTLTYDFAPIAGTYWMHSHEGLQEQRLMTAPLIVHTAEDMREDRQDVVLMLHDFSFAAPEKLLAQLTGQPVSAAYAMAHLTENVSAPAPSADGVAGMMRGSMQGMPGMTMQGSMQGMGSMQMGGMSAGGMAGMSSRAGMDLNDIDYDAFLANDRTLADPELVRVERRGRLRLRVINGASSSQFWLNLGSLTGRVVAVDGHEVHPVSGSVFPISMAQRLDILLDLPGPGAFPILAQLEGSNRRTGIVLATPGAQVTRLAEAGLGRARPVDNSLEIRLAATQPLMARKPDMVHQIVLAGSMTPYKWSLNGQYWPNIAPLMLTKGQRVEIELVNQSMMAHPIHLHGHTFQVIAVNGQPIKGAVRDTVIVTPNMGSVRLAFDADNPGRWALHCHNLYHMMTGMMTEFRYQDIAV